MFFFSFWKAQLVNVFFFSLPPSASLHRRNGVLLLRINNVATNSYSQSQSDSVMWLPIDVLPFGMNLRRSHKKSEFLSAKLDETILVRNARQDNQKNLIIVRNTGKITKKKSGAYLIVHANQDNHKFCNSKTSYIPGLWKMQLVNMVQILIGHSS